MMKVDTIVNASRIEFHWLDGYCHRIFRVSKGEMVEWFKHEGGWKESEDVW